MVGLEIHCGLPTMCFQELSGQLAKVARMLECPINPSLLIIKSCQLINAHMHISVFICEAMLYGSEAWVEKADQIRRLELFHNHCERGFPDIEGPPFL